MGNISRCGAWLTFMLWGAGCLGQVSGGKEPFLAPVPPMGWNSWFGVGCKVTDVDVRAHADIMLRKGMKDLGYTYVNIDGCWEGARDSQGIIHPTKFQVPRHEGSGGLPPQQGF
jgi:hypothetical protein